MGKKMFKRRPETSDLSPPEGGIETSKRTAGGQNLPFSDSHHQKGPKMTPIKKKKAVGQETFHYQRKRKIVGKAGRVSQFLKGGERRRINKKNQRKEPLLIPSHAAQFSRGGRQWNLSEIHLLE